MNKSRRTVASAILLVVGSIAVGFGFTGIDFAFGDDRWTPGRVSNFPFIGIVPTPTAFFLGSITVMLGLVAVIIGARLAISNYSTIKKMWMIASGLALIAWSFWGTAFTANALLNRLPGGEEYNTVDIPCGALGPCRIPSELWYFMNVGMMGIGLVMIVVGIKTSRYVTAY